MPVKVCTGALSHDPARRPRCLSAGDLYLGGCVRLSKNAGPLILVQALPTLSKFALTPKGHSLPSMRHAEQY
jgi:hypothetical protein